MADEFKPSLVDIGSLSKPFDTLVKKIAKAVGGIAAPGQIKRIAKAEAEAAIIKAQSNVEIGELQRRAIHRFIEEEAKHQQNMDEITAKTKGLLNPAADAEQVEDDWITNFFDKSRIVSDADMQELWSRVLAGEVNEPGKFAKRTVNLLGDFDKNDAELFTTLCRFVWDIGGLHPFVFDGSPEIYAANGINFNSIIHLEDIGLIKFQTNGSFMRSDMPQQFTVFYYGVPTVLTMPEGSSRQLQLGKVLFTKAGLELAQISGAKPLKGFREFMHEAWGLYNPQ
jgi:hypothetical protein